MSRDDHEQEDLRSVALQNAASILVARQRAERELVAAKEALERKSEELARSAAQLREQREWFRVTLASIGDAVITTDLNSCVTFLNPVAEKMTGWTSAEALGRTLHDVFQIVHEHTRALVEPPIAKALREGATVGLANHTSLLTRGGGEIAIEDSAAPIRDEAGRVTGAVMVFHDVTERRRSEEALRASEERMRAILRQAAVGIAVNSLDGRFEEVNEKFVQVLGYSAAELCKLHIADITFPEDLPETRAQMKRLLAGETNEYAYEKRFVRKDGKIVWGLTSVTTLKDAHGSPHHFVGIIEDITARKQAEAGLQRNEAELRALADSIPQLAWMAEPDGNIFWYNQKWFTYTGTTLEQMKGWGWQTVHDPAILPRVLERWRASIRTGEPFEMEFPLRGADAVFRWFLTRVNPVRDAAGNVARWFGTNTDVDQVKRAEDALREETRVLELLNKTGTAIGAELDLQVLLQRVTDAGTALSGAKFGAFFYTARDENGAALMLYTLSGAPREAFEKFGHPRATPIFRPTFEGGPPVRIDDVLKDPRYGQMPPHHGMPHGHLPVRSFLSVPVMSRSGEVFGGLFFGHPEPAIFTARSERIILGVAAQAAVAIDNARLYEAAQKEIAERGRTEERLRANEARLRVSLETAALGTWDLDLKDGTLTLDERCQVLFGTTRPTVSMEDFIAFGHADDRAARHQALREIIAGERERYDIEYRVVNLRWVKASAKPVRDSGGRVVRVIGAVLDITDLMQARATMEERRKDLERLVAERTASLQEAVAQMEEFSYSVSHDLRAPLRSIQTYAQVVLEDHGGEFGPEVRDYLQRIINAGGRMDRLTRDVLIYSKIARGDAPSGAVPLQRVVDETIEQYAPAERENGLVTVAQPLLPVWGNEPLLVQAISNLLANAIKFVAPGTTPRVHFWTERRGEEVRLWVEDNGIGISPEYQSRIWGMFERVHPKEHYDGTGIGLAIVRKTIERMGGTVGVESSGKQGSRFWIQLRAAEA